jgi:uncharacterized membrane protein
MQEHEGLEGAAEYRPADLERRVTELLGRQTAADVNALHEERIGLGERAADLLADKAGSWGFIGSFLVVLGIWMSLNVAGLLHPWDPYPFILLNLVLSCIAAIQAPVIMMSQKRQEVHDRLHAESDFQVNVKAEVLLEHLTKEIEEIKAAVLAQNSRGHEDSGPQG